MDNAKRKIVRLKNGITILIVPMKTKLTNVSVSILLGEHHEKEKEIELTHYVEHLMGRFTSKKYNDFEQIQKELNKRGARSNASVEKYKTKFFIEGLYKDAEYYMDLLANMIKDFSIEKNLMQHEKNAVMQELRNMIDDSKYMFRKKICKYKYPSLAYKCDMEKHSKSVKNYTSKQIYDFIKRKILLHNTVVSVTCPHDAVDNTIQMAKKYFRFRNVNPNGYVKYPIYRVVNKSLKIVHVKDKSRSNNTNVRYEVSKRIEYLSKKHLSLICLNQILFNFETGIFYKILREGLGLIYNISLHLQVDIMNPVSSAYYIETSVKIDKTSTLIKNIIDILKNLKLTDNEIQNGKKRVLINHEYLKFNNLTSYTNHYEQFLLFKHPIIERSEIADKIRDLSTHDIRSTLNQFRNELLHNGMLFYYSRINMNDKIKKLLKNKINTRKMSYAIKYISL